MGEFYASVPILLVSILASYLLGALPLADQISRRQGVDIFSAGTGLPGASNVLKCVGKWQAAFVLTGDIAKGALAVLLAQFLGVDGLWTLLPAAAAIVGHWASILSGLRGGDGLATLGGITLALFPAYGVICVAIGGLVALGGQKMPYTSLLSIVSGYAVLATFTFTNYGDAAVTLGTGGLAALVWARASLGHRRRRRGDHWADVGDTGTVGEPLASEPSTESG